jgi:capsular polysaccharide export protein
MGPFFWRLRKDLEAAGAQVDKINFCAGDQLFYPRNALRFQGTLEEWPQFLFDRLTTGSYDAVMLFGDCRPHHCVVPHVLRFLGVRLYVFEEGYLRPHFITIEPDGVNNFSAMPRDPSFYRDAPLPPTEHPPETRAAPHSFFWSAVYAIAFAVVNHAFAWTFPKYQHHRPLNPFYHGFVWIRSALRKVWFGLRERTLLQGLVTTHAGRYFLVPLQVHNDSQVVVHSDFTSIPGFLDQVLQSFSQHADPDDLLVVKHHPADRGHTCYRRTLQRLSRRHGLVGRVLYVHDLHLPTLLDHARGTIVINSTVGLSSILHHTPVVTLGDPVYNIPGLTHQGGLDRFWRDPGTVDRALFTRYRAWLLAHNQANGSFHQRLPGAASHTGIVWPPGMGAAQAEPGAASKRRQAANGFCASVQALRADPIAPVDVSPPADTAREAS